MPRPRSSASIASLIAVLGDDALGALELTQRLGCSQPTLSRLVRAAGTAVVTLGRAQQTRYARARASGVEQPMPVTRIDSSGAPQPCGYLHTVGMATGSRTAWVAARQVSVHDGLPWFVADMRPQGFLGRQFPARVPQLGLPPSVADWNDDHVLQALCAAGADEPGDLIVGRAALDIFLREGAPAPIAQVDKARIYRQLALGERGGQSLRSSAGGEQAKFTAYVSRSESAAHAIVKFTPEGDDVIAQRWRDLLRAELHALNVLREDGRVPAAAAQLIDDSRLYLEVERFDRIGARGRRGVVSLAALDDTYVGQRHDWVKTAQHLQRIHLLREAGVERIALLYAFGLLIHNSDMHFGNCALLHDGPGTLEYSLAPAYDMLPMRFAPTAHGLRAAELPPVHANADVLAVWGDATRLAREFWQRVQDDPAVSRDFQQIARAATP
jgi:HipA-like C-terminal domain